MNLLMLQEAEVIRVNQPDTTFQILLLSTGHCKSGPANKLQNLLLSSHNINQVLYEKQDKYQKDTSRARLPLP